MKQVTERRKSEYDDLHESESITDLQIKYSRMKQLETENNQLKNMVQSRDEQINDLKREIDKLKVSNYKERNKTNFSKITFVRGLSSFLAERSDHNHKS